MTVNVSLIKLKIHVLSKIWHNIRKSYFLYLFCNSNMLRNNILTLTLLLSFNMLYKITIVYSKLRDVCYLQFILWFGEYWKIIHVSSQSHWGILCHNPRFAAIDYDIVVSSDLIWYIEVLDVEGYCIVIF